MKQVCLFMLTALLGSAWLSGCASDGKPKPTGFASVVIPNRSREEIQQATLTVFISDGYRAVVKPEGKMQFEKEASRSTRNAYSSFGETFKEKVDVRVRAEIESLGLGTHRLHCNAWIVRDAGDAFGEEELKVSSFGRKPYQKLLDDVAARLK